MNRNLKRISANLFLFLLAGLILLPAACAGPTRAAPNTPAAALKNEPASACDLPACANLVVTQDGQPGSVQAAAPFAHPPGLSAGSPWKIDTGTPSPDGAWVAYTSISSESGGPVLLQDIQSGEWTNLIEAVNAHLPVGQPPLAQDFIWDVIGWFPDSARLMIGPVDLSLVVVVDLTSYAAQPIGFPGGGLGGRQFVNLAPDGSRFIYVGDDASGNQVVSAFDLATGQSTELLRLPYQEGVLSNPRFSPDQSSVAYLLQTGQPDPGLAYSIHLLSPQTGETRLLAGDNVAVTVPLWSPDGQSIAFVRKEPQPAAPSIKGAVLPAPELSNVWVISVADGKLTQVSFMDGFVRSPAWAKDSQTLAFVTGDGQVELANLAQPGKSWQAAGVSAVPELTNVFFLP